MVIIQPPCLIKKETGPRRSHLMMLGKSRIPLSKALPLSGSVVPHARLESLVCISPTQLEFYVFRGGNYLPTNRSVLGCRVDSHISGRMPAFRKGHNDRSGTDTNKILSVFRINYRTRTPAQRACATTGTPQR